MIRVSLKLRTKASSSDSKAMTLKTWGKRIAHAHPQWPGLNKTRYRRYSHVSQPLRGNGLTLTEIKRQALASFEFECLLCESAGVISHGNDVGIVQRRRWRLLAAEWHYCFQNDQEIERGHPEEAGREDSRKKGRTRDVIAKRSQKCLQKCGQTKGQTQGQTSKFEVTMWNRFVLDRAWEKRGETTVCSPVLRSQQEEIRHSMSVEENSKNIEIPKFPLSPR